MRLIDADKLKRHYAWWENTDLGKEYKKIFDDIVDLQPTVDITKLNQKGEKENDTLEETKRNK